MIENIGDKPKILVISHNCFSHSGSNGRTLGNFFEGYPKDKLAQFYIVNEDPDWDVCERYFRITDGEIVKSICRDKKLGHCVKVKKTNIVGNEETANRSVLTRIKSSSASLFMRELLWKEPLWNKEKLYRWIERFCPDMILYQAGNLGYLCELAVDISRKYDIPLLVYNSEGYYLKKYDYIKGTFSFSFWFSAYMFLFKNSFEKLMRNARAAIYISEDLRNAYRKIFDIPSYYIMTATSNAPILKKEDEIKKISYLGNLGLGRHKSLIEIATILQEIDKKYNIDVYGNAPEQQIIDDLKQTDGIQYHGVVSYEEVRRIINSSDINIHVEGFEPFFVEDSKYAFSTKIADLLASGNVLLMYAPENLTSTRYIAENECGCVINNYKDLKYKIKEILDDSKLRNYYIENAKKIVEQNHNMERNKIKFLEILINESVTN